MSTFIDRVTLLKTLQDESSSYIDIESTLLDLTDLSFFSPIIKQEEIPTEISLLDTVLKNYKDKLSEQCLVHLLKLTYSFGKEISNYFATIHILEELIQRDSINGQYQFIELYQQVLSVNTNSQRYFAETVQDHIIDKVLPQFNIKPLCKFFLNLSPYNLDIECGNSMLTLFPHIMYRVKNSVMEKDILKKWGHHILNHPNNDISDIICTLSEKTFSKEAISYIQKIDYHQKKQYKEKSGTTLTSLLQIDDDVVTDQNKLIRSLISDIL